MIDDPLKPYETPDRWTPDHVMMRMVQAFETLARMRVKTGPKGYGSGWPSYVHDWEDLLAQEETEAAEQARKKYQSRDVILPPDSHSVSMMEEAFIWPVRYLSGAGRKTVFIVEWAMFTSRGSEWGGAISMVHMEATSIAMGLAGDRIVVR